MIYVQIIAVIVTLLIGGLSILVNLKSIKTNKDIAKENRDILEKNAGKHRITYSIEEITASEGHPSSYKMLNEKLNTGDYAILGSFQNRSNSSERIYTLGKIKP